MSIGCQRPAATTVTVEPTTSVQPRCVSAPPATRLRRLTRLEWQATVSQVLGVDAVFAVPDDEGLGFSTVAEAQAASVTLSEKLLEAAETATASMNVTALSPCPPSDACAPRVIERLGEKLFRRAMTADERDRLGETWKRVRTTEDVDTASRLVTQVMLQSPSFLFKLEQPRADEPALLDDGSLAARLAFALTGTGPDEALRVAANAGSLRTREGLRAEAERLLSTPAARRTIGRFHVEWLGLSALTRLSRGAPPASFLALGALQTDLLALALACDVTRVASLQWTRSASPMVFSWERVTIERHELSHHADDDASARADLTTIHRWYAQQFARLLGRLEATVAGPGVTLLDQSVIVWGNELGQGNTHSHRSVPFVVAGGGGGTLESGLLETRGGSHAELLLACAQAAGAPLTTFGDPAFCQQPMPGVLR